MFSKHSILLLCLGLASVIAPGCVTPITVPVDAWCEGTNPVHCMLPWPSDRWLIDDPGTDTGKRLNYSPDALPRNINRDDFNVSAYNTKDGFSPASALLTAFSSDVDTAATEGLALEGMWDLSLAANSPSIVIDIDSGERVAHMGDVAAHCVMARIMVAVFVRGFVQSHY